jgi:SAM-dependent methyltransferase
MKKYNFIKLKKKYQKYASYLPYHRWHPEVALRYLPIVSEIKMIAKNTKVLDVGSGGLGIAPYLKQKVVGLDKDFHPPYHKLLNKIKGNALRLPFKDRSFDVVITVDMLEHLPKSDRQKAISEMIRVAEKYVIIAVPCGKLAEDQDKRLNLLHLDKFGKEHHFLTEQTGFHLPEEKDIVDNIKVGLNNINFDGELRIKNNENLGLRYFLMRGWITKSFIIEIIFRKIFLLFIPFFLLLNHKPVYRKIFILSIKDEHID